MTANPRERSIAYEASFPDPPPNDKFHHVFEGWSVWLEPSAGCSSNERNVEKEILIEMEKLRNECGGQDKGLHSFVPHCTLLYNLPIPDQLNSKEEEQYYGKRMLQKCLESFQLENISTNAFQSPEECTTAQRRDDDVTSSPQQILLEPTETYYFDYPKSADNGRGFGCVISMLLLKNTPKLALLQKIVKNEFPPDERHGGESKFIPHMALVYAPEEKGAWLQKYTTELPRRRKEFLRPFPARILSLWSTKGKVCDWYRIAKIDI